MEAFAPWAEPVLMTADELLQLPEDAWRYELVDGRLVRMSPTGREHGLVVMALLGAVYRYVSERHLGEVLPAETGFWISSPGSPDTVLAPDLAFIRTGREPKVGSAGYPRLAPDLVAEVTSPSQRRAELATKAQRWLNAGVEVVWLVLPEQRVVEVWRHGEDAAVLTVEDELLGDEVLLGFSLPVRRLFG